MNLAGVEIILNMREKMEAMQRQMEGFIATLNQELSERAAHRPVSNNSLMLVIQINSLTQRVDGKRAAAEGKRKAK